MTALVLGPFIFTGIENPEQVPFGGDQDIAMHKLIGGVRVLDAMGPSEQNIKWSGRLQGPTAEARARQLDGMRLSGAEFPLSFSTIFRMVVITKADFTFERRYQILYTIECTVTRQPGASDGTDFFAFDTLVNGDIGAALSIVADFASAAISFVAEGLGV